MVAFSMIGEPDRYCHVCHDFYHERTDNQCSEEGCQTHRRCPECELCKDYTFDFRAWEDRHRGTNPGIEEEISEGALIPSRFPKHNLCLEQDGFPSESGYIDCWICKATFCNQDFTQHYPICRKKVSNRCGFKPKGDDRCVCNPGNCGKELTNNDYFFECQKQIDSCGTLCCSACVQVCRGSKYDEKLWREVSCEEFLCEHCYSGRIYGEKKNKCFACSNGY
jgi:hypothetical protein